MDVPPNDLELQQHDAIEEGEPVSSSWEPFAANTTTESKPDIQEESESEIFDDPDRNNSSTSYSWSASDAAAIKSDPDPTKRINIRETESGDQLLLKPTAFTKETESVNKPSPAPSSTNRRDSSPTSNRRPTMASGTKKLLWAFALVVLLVIIGVIAASLKKVSSTEMGVQYNIHKKQLEDATKSGGLFIGPPGYRFIKFPSTFITVDLNDRMCVSNDGLIVQFSVTFQYQMTAANVLPAIIKYRDYHKWASIVEQAGLSAVHHSCSEFLVSEFQNKRGIIQSRMEDNLKLKLQGNETSGEEGVNAVAVSLQLVYIDLPEKYNEAVREKQAAEEDIALAVAQRTQETTKANTALLKAREEARKIEDTANNEAEVLLTEARLKAEETRYSFQKEAEALVEVKEKLDLTTEGVLAYLSNRLLSEASTLKVTTGEPAKLSRRDEL
mmetsp:Transcript_623/g.1126  ORF Transcript_623/g.1126 Transcript_623/m.1126 type:complete len:442 (+) Transcript_623:139-1464(+)